MDNQRNHFLENEFITMSILGALGRSNTYIEKADDKLKEKLRKDLRRQLFELGHRYGTVLTEEEHIENIATLSDDLSQRYKACLVKGRFRIGIAQKALNLYLKYLWCAGTIARPLHCPFDSIVIRKLLAYKGPRWTQIDDIEQYKTLVILAKQVANGKPLSEWELALWNEAVVENIKTIKD